jgi:hypothetical protein
MLIIFVNYLILLLCHYQLAFAELQTGAKLVSLPAEQSDQVSHLVLAETAFDELSSFVKHSLLDDNNWKAMFDKIFHNFSMENTPIGDIKKVSVTKFENARKFQLEEVPGNLASFKFLVQDLHFEAVADYWSNNKPGKLTVFCKKASFEVILTLGLNGNATFIPGAAANPHVTLKIPSATFSCPTKLETRNQGHLGNFFFRTAAKAANLPLVNRFARNILQNLINAGAKNVVVNIPLNIIAHGINGGIKTVFNRDFKLHDKIKFVNTRVQRVKRRIVFGFGLKIDNRILPSTPEAIFQTYFNSPINMNWKIVPDSQGIFKLPYSAFKGSSGPTKSQSVYGKVKHNVEPPPKVKDKIKSFFGRKPMTPVSNQS